MRILMTTDTVGGVWTFTQELAKGLIQQGCKIYLISFGDAPSPAQMDCCEQITAQWNDSFHYESVTLPLEWMEDNAHAFVDAAPLLLKRAAEFDAELFHSNQLCFGGLPLAISKVVTVHSDVLSWAESCCKGMLEPSAWLDRYCRLVRKGLREADLLITPTYWMKEALQRHYELSHDILVILNGRSIPTHETRPRQLRAITAGRLWDEAKNINMLREVHAPMPLLIAGGSSYVEGAFHRDRDVCLLGALDQDDLLDVFRGSSIYICTSCYEPFGLAPLEAALCGCAVVANDIPSLREVWQDGALYFSGSPSLTALLHRLNEAPLLLHSAQGASRRRACYLSAERMTRQYLHYFQRACVREEDDAHVS
jgi:glycogen synthase